MHENMMLFEQHRTSCKHFVC